MTIDVRCGTVVNRYHLGWVTFAGDFTESSTLLVQASPQKWAVT